MKKIAIALAGLMSLCLLCGCEKEDDRYERLNGMLAMDYSEIVLTVEEDFGVATLTSGYTISYGEETRVRYEVERFSEIGSDLLPPVPSFKAVLRGEAVIRDGELSFTGDDVRLTPAIAEIGLTFEESCFRNAAFTDMTMTADVADPSAFFGTELSCSGMKVGVTFLGALLTISVSYLSESGSSVKIQYIFTV